MKSNVWTDLQGRVISLASLDVAERQLIERCRKHSESHALLEYRNFWKREVADFYAQRGLSRSEIVDTPAWRIAQDIASRRMVDEGEARLPDYRDDLEHLIQSRFSSRRAFCEASGISEDMLSHVLARRKHLSVPALTEALNRVGCRLRIVVEESEPATK